MIVDSIEAIICIIKVFLFVLSIAIRNSFFLMISIWLFVGKALAAI